MGDRSARVWFYRQREANLTQSIASGPGGNHDWSPAGTKSVLENGVCVPVCWVVAAGNGSDGGGSGTNC